MAIDGRGASGRPWRSRGAGLAGLLVSAAGALNAGGPGAGPEFQVNTYSNDSQAWSSVAMMPTGEFVLVWASYGSAGSDSSASSIQGQRYDADGDPAGPEFQANTITSGSQFDPHVDYAADGSFVVVWDTATGAGDDNDAQSISAQRFAANGSPVGPEFQVNSYITGGQTKLEVAVAGGGDFVVVWGSVGSPGDDTLAGSIVGRRFLADGTPLAPDFQVNSYTTNTQADAGVDMATDGSFVVTWDSDRSAGTDDTNRSVHAQIFGSDGTRSGGELQLNSYTTNSQDNPQVAVLPSGEFVVVWESQGSFGTDDSG